MNTALLTGVGAGLASALLYLSMTTGQPLAVVLFYVAPLPLFIAGLGWGIATAIVAAVVGAIATYALSYGFLALTYAVSCAVPCALLVRTALLSRPLDDANPDGPREWYPAGRLLLWTAAAGAAVTAAAIMAMGGDRDGFDGIIDMVIRHGLFGPAGIEVPQAVNVDTMVTVLKMFLAPVSAGLWTFFAVANLWIAGRVLQASGRAPRPMPDLPGMQFPKSASLAFIAAAAISAAGGTIGLYAQAALGGLVVAFALLGLAVVHGYTRAMALRGPILVGVYLVTIVFPWSLGILALIGLADTWLDLRANRPPTAGNDNSG